MKRISEYVKKKTLSVQVGLALSFTVVSLFAMGVFGITMYHLFVNRMESMMSESA